jgi:hypothetical protein
LLFLSLLTQLFVLFFFDLLIFINFKNLEKLFWESRKMVLDSDQQNKRTMHPAIERVFDIPLKRFSQVLDNILFRLASGLG